MIEFDPHRVENSVSINVREQPPPEFGLIIGDCLHNLRSALDSLAYDLARACKGEPLPDDIAKTSEFPIFIDPAKFAEQRERKIGATAPDVQAVIEELQPYHGRNNFASLTSLIARHRPYAHHPLWLLHELSRRDKHRLPNLTLFAPLQVIYGGHNASFTFPEPRDATSVKDSAELFSYGPLHTDSDELEVEFYFDCGIAFEEGPPAYGESVLLVLARLRTYIISEVVPRLRPFLP